MVNVLINGIGGKMGKMLIAAASINPEVTVTCGVDKFFNGELGIPVYRSFAEVTQKVDCIIDFSVKAALYEVIPYAVANGTPVVLATTGYDADDIAYLTDAATKVAVFRTGNMSLGINVLSKLVKAATELLGDKADIEIVEAHHNQKVDAPSGTAIMLYDSAKEARPALTPIYGREGIVGKRTHDEVGIHAIRGGTIVGKHEVMFILDNEVITLKHESESKAIFANGALNAAVFLKGKTKGLFNMSDIL